MTTRTNSIDIAVGRQHIAATLVGPETTLPGVILVHGWDGSQAQYIDRAHEIATLGCVCLTFDLRGHARHQSQRESVTREENLQDVLAAYDLLAGHPAVDPRAIAIVGSSYGGYLAAIASSLRPVQWLALRVPALYMDGDWDLPKQQLGGEQLAAYRRSELTPESNRALAACASFRGDVLIVESEHDSVVPHPVIKNYLAACTQARSLTYRMISDADHALSEKHWQETYTSLLVSWMSEMVQGARAGKTGGASAQLPLASAEALHSSGAAQPSP